ncbi:choice-of-anchor P family protein [Nocardioides humi]|uniref:choice-of-anchor P family protein n=1 Tax=Nocardioides humi TaxID=449461 RepID=UPI0011274DCD|nr:choice-of-anchor P family protein [Nocardioides humi]
MGAGLVAVPAPAQAAEPVYWSYAASTGATYVKLLDGVVQSDLTAQSSVTGGAKSSSSKNSTAAANILNLAELGAVETTTDATVQQVLGQPQTTLKSWARTAQVKLLGGLITADALETTVTTTGRANGTGSYTANSRLANIKIAGVKLPLNIPKNYAVTIPGVASVTLNYTLHGKIEQPEGDLIGTMGWAVGVTLLQPLGGYSAGVTLLVNPVNQYLSEVAPSSGASFGGTAYGSRVQANVSDAVTVVSDPTARVGTPVGGSNGRTLSNSTLAVRVPGVLNTGAITSTTMSKKDAFGNGEITNTNRTTGINLLGGLVKANAVKVTAAGKLQDGQWTSDMKMELVNLVIAGQKIPIDVSPNTILNIAGLGQVALNLQQTNTNGAYQNAITAVRVTLDTAQAGLPIGAVIELGVAYTAIAPPAA